MSELKLSLSKETTDRFRAYLQSEIYLKEQNLTEHWGKRQQGNIEAFRVEANNIIIKLNKSSGLFVGDLSQNFVTSKDTYKLIKKTGEGWGSKHIRSYIISRLISYKIILLRRLGCYTGIAFDPLYHFERLWAKGEIAVEDIIAEYGGKIDSSTIVKGSHIYNEINEIINLSGLNLTKIIEIGPGLGSCLRMIKKYKPETKFFLIDLPTSIPYSFTNLIYRFPEAKFILPNEANASSNFDKYDFIFLSNEQIHLLKKNEFDLAINSMSFAEMRKSDIVEYFRLLRRVLKKENLFYCLNAVEKPMIYDGLTVPIRFFEYPWSSKDWDYKYEISRVEQGRTY